jgi:hypothetical protein
VPDSTATIPEYQCKNVTDRAELHPDKSGNFRSHAGTRAMKNKVEPLIFGKKHPENIALI